ncbi:unnamed protein product [Closterium sp. NIES-53]
MATPHEEASKEDVPMTPVDELEDFPDLDLNAKDVIGDLPVEEEEALENQEENGEHEGLDDLGTDDNFSEEFEKLQSAVAKQASSLLQQKCRRSIGSSGGAVFIAPLLAMGSLLLLPELQRSSRCRLTYPHLGHLLPEVDCGPNAWTVLKELHALTSVVATLMLERELSALRLSEGEPVQPVLDNLRDLYAKLATAGITYP